MIHLAWAFDETPPCPDAAALVAKGLAVGVSKTPEKITCLRCKIISQVSG